MQRQIERQMRDRAEKLLSSGDVQLVIAWKEGDFPCYPEPAFFVSAEQLDDLIYNRFCTSNLSKYMIDVGKRPGKTLVFLRPCDTYSFNQLLKEHQIRRDNSFVIGVGCEGCAAVDEGEERGLLESCRVCTKTEHKVYDELIGEGLTVRETADENKRFDDVKRLESMESEERYNFWRDRLSKCMRCNACRNICPVCHCNKCVFDNPDHDTRQKVNVTSFEGQMFHVVRAFHVAGRCSDCGQCSRVCPQGISLHLLNRKIIKDINTLYGEFQAGEDAEALGPLSTFDENNDPEP